MAALVALTALVAPVVAPYDRLHGEAARALGTHDRRIILPNCLSPLIVPTTLVFAYAVSTEAALSFLGVGAPPAMPLPTTVPRRVTSLS